MNKLIIFVFFQLMGIVIIEGSISIFEPTFDESMINSALINYMWRAFPINRTRQNLLNDVEDGISNTRFKIMHDIHLNVEKAMMSVENIIKISHDNRIDSSCFDKQKIVVINAYSLAVSDLDECIRFKKIKFLKNDFHSVESITKQIGLKFVGIMNECMEFYVAEYDICVKNRGKQLKKYIKSIKNELNTVDTDYLVTTLQANIYDCWQSPYQSLNSTLSHVSQQLREYANSPAICEN